MHLFAWRWTFALACLVWLGGTAAGYSAMASVDASPFAAEAAAAAEEAPKEAEMAAEAEMESWALFTFILGRNAMVYCWLLTGLLCGGVSTFLVLAGNGLMLGQAMGAATASGMPASALADLLLTHGVLEIGTFCVAGAVGFQGLWLLMHWSKSGWPAVRALRLGWVFAFGAVALTLAAGVEAFVTAELAAGVAAADGET